MSSGNPNTTDRADKDSWDEALLGGSKEQNPVSAVSLTDNISPKPPASRPSLVPAKKNPLLLPSVGMALALLLSSGYFLSAEAMVFDWQKHIGRIQSGASLTVTAVSEKTFSAGGYLAGTFLNSFEQVSSGLTGMTASVGNSMNGFSENISKVGSQTTVAVDDLGASVNDSAKGVFAYFDNLFIEIEDKIVLGYFHLGQKANSVVDMAHQKTNSFVSWTRDKVLFGVNFIDQELNKANAFLRESKNASIKRAGALSSSAATGMTDVASSTQKAIDDTKVAGETILTKVNNFISSTSDRAGNYWNRIVFRWKVFLGFESEPASAVAEAGYGPEDRAALQSVKAGVDEILRQLADRPVAVTPAQTASDPGGMVVVPSSGDANTDAVIKANIANMFSDEVVVNPDGSGRSGVITPVFRSGAGNDYLYILAPISN